MFELISLWLPILVTGIVLFVASFVAWTILPHHKPDWHGLPDEEQFLQLIRHQPVRPGQYMFPYCADFSEMKNPEVKQRHEAGPHGTLHVWPGLPNMGLNMAKTFTFFLVTSLFVAYLGTLGLEPGAEFSPVFQLTGTAAILAYCFAFIPHAIWFATPTRAVLMDVLDGVVYGLLSGAIFGWLWP